MSTILPSTYNEGTVSVASSGTVVTGVGTTWVNTILPGDFFSTPSGLSVRILEVTDNTHLTLAYPWPGPAVTTGAYEIRFQADMARMQETSRQLLQKLMNGNIDAFAGLTGALDKIPIFTGPGAMTTIDRASLVAGIDYDVQVNTLADRATYDGSAAGFKVLVANVGDGRAALYYKKTNTSADWSAAAYITGATGGIGPAGPPYNPRGTYSGATAYAQYDTVLYNGSTFVALTATTGNAPPTLPTTSNAWWQLLAQKGTDGAGTGDVTGPASSIADQLVAFSGTTGKVIKAAPNGSVSNALLANMSQATLKGRISAGSGAPEDLTPAQARGAIEAYLLGGFRNGIINGNFTVAQAGTSLASGTGTRYCLDQWRVLSVGSTVSTSRQSHTLGQTLVPGNPEFFLRVVVATVAGAGNYAILQHRIEGVRKYAGKKITVVFYAAADAAKSIGMELGQEFGSGGSPSASVYTAAGAKALTTTIQKIAFTVDVPSISGKTLGSNAGSDALDLTFWLDAGSTFASRASGIGQQNITLDISRVSIVEGDATQEADPFSERPFVIEDILCKRHYYQGQLPLRGIVNASASLAARLGGPLPVKMRTNPTVSIAGSVYDGSNTMVLNGVQTNYSTTEAVEADVLLTTSGVLAVGRMCLLFAPSTVVADARM